jgi:hypothetical protein
MPKLFFVAMPKSNLRPDSIVRENFGLYQRQVDEVRGINGRTGIPMSRVYRELIDIGLSKLENCNPPLACLTPGPSECKVHALVLSPLGIESEAPEAD